MVCKVAKDRNVDWEVEEGSNNGWEAGILLHAGVTLGGLVAIAVTTVDGLYGE